MRNFFVLILTALALNGAWATEATQVFGLKVTEKGFEPSTLNVKPDMDTTLKITRLTEDTCATDIQIPKLKIKKELPLNEIVEIQLGKLKKGEIRFGCNMQMMIGGIIHIQ